MPISVFPAPAGIPLVNAQQAAVATQSQTFTVGAWDMFTPDPLGIALRSFINVPVLYNNTAYTGAIFSVTVTGSNGDRFLFQSAPIGAGGAVWRETAAMDMSNGYWDYMHRTYDSGGIYEFLVPAMGTNLLRMVRVAGAPGAGTCIGWGVASHSAFPSPPKYVGKRDVTLMIRGQSATAAYALVAFDTLVANDDRTRTLTNLVTSRFTTGGKRLWIQGYDLSYLPNGVDRVKVDVIARANGAVSLTEANSPPVFELSLFSAPGRAVTLPEPIELQNALGSSQGSVGIKAIATVGGAASNLGGTIFCFETL